MSEGTCDVSIGGYDGDSAEVFHSAVVTTRAGCKCDECGEAIAPRQRYERNAGKFDGEWSVWRLCLPCMEIMAEFSDGDRMFGGVMWESLEDNWGDGARLQACLNRLTTVAAKERMRSQWMKWKRLP